MTTICLYESYYFSTRPKTGNYKRVRCTPFKKSYKYHLICYFQDLFYVSNGLSLYLSAFCLLTIITIILFLNFKESFLDLLNFLLNFFIIKNFQGKLKVFFRIINLTFFPPHLCIFIVTIS